VIMDEKVMQLSDMGAGEFEHVNGALLDHLNGTRDILLSWDASAALQDAGLYHAAYGTAGFDEQFVSIEQRHSIAQIIGKEAENFVYLYCACDRNHVWPQFGVEKHIEYKDRFTNELLILTHQELHCFCELTAANELEIALNNPGFVCEHGQALYDLFTRMEYYLSARAMRSVRKVFGA